METCIGSFGDIGGIGDVDVPGGRFSFRMEWAAADGTRMLTCFRGWEWEQWRWGRWDRVYDDGRTGVREQWTFDSSGYS